MTRVGMRELRHRLREYLRRVEAGDEFEVTLFGRPVAHLGPIRGAQGHWERLVSEGRVTPPLDPDSRRLPEVAPPTTGTTATDALLAERAGDTR